MRDKAFDDGLCEIHPLYLLVETLYTIANITEEHPSVVKLEELHEHFNINMILISGHSATKPVLVCFVYI